MERPNMVIVGLLFMTGCCVFTNADIDACRNSTLNNCSKNANCTNTAGSYTCMCKSGWTGNGTVCTDVDECSDANDCSRNANCSNTEGSYTCTCKIGWNGDGKTCTDIDECRDSTLKNCNTNANCTNTAGSYTCMCKSGWTGNGTVCTDIDECRDSTLNNCNKNADCTNTAGSYTCMCKSGWTGNGTVCTDIDECSDLTLNNCNTNANCTNTAGSYTCMCKSGWTGNGTVCTDVDECSDINDCNGNANCSNTEGSYTCTCKTGWNGDGKNCTDIDECRDSTLNNCNTNANCTNTAGSYTCMCKSGWTGNGTVCTDIDECRDSTLNNCNKNADCTNTAGSYTCMCKSGWTGNGTVCTDIDECSDLTLNNCNKNADCTNTAGSYTCMCKSGWTGNGTVCTDVDECSDINDCNGNANCSNTEGSYTCTCKTGWNGDGKNCTDIDECSNSTLNNCNKNANCTNTAGSYSCNCKSGWAGNGTVCIAPAVTSNTATTQNEATTTTTAAPTDKTTVNATTTTTTASNSTTTSTTTTASPGSSPGPCDSKDCHNGTCNEESGNAVCSCTSGYTGESCDTDIDECSNSTLNNCSKNADCTNTAGSYTCMCKSGWTGNGTVCTDIDECRDSTLNNCNINANCTNTAGSYTCMCKSGWTGNGTVCTDIDECSDLTLNNCNINANCTNSPGSYTCMCKSGWTGNGTVCTDIDECSDLTLNNCNINANCTNSPGSYTCMCKSGWTGNGTACTDVDECSDANDCNGNAICSNTEGSYTCTCKTGWNGDGKNCTDVDECSDANDCNGNAICSNTEGSYTCTCKIGWNGDGKNCTDIDECTDDTDNCDEHAKCANTAGSFTCTCNPGWTGDGTTCTDIDECTDDTDNCDEHAKCANTAGSFTCTCNPGWTGDGTNCTDINECENVTCLHGGTCVNLINDYNCSCTDGWTGKTCGDDINECLDKTHECHSRANCSNTEGSYNCTCRDGFEGDGKNCSDINECNTNPCNTTGSNNCFNTVGSFKCLCKPGWTGVNCTQDINECTDGSANCDHNAACNNTLGSFNCTCNQGYRGNGVTCTEIVLLEFSGDEQKTGDDEVYGPFSVATGIPYNEKLYYQVYVSVNGYLTLGNRFNRTYPPSNNTWTFLQFPIIYPMWANIQTGNESSGLKINQFTEGNQYASQLDEISSAFNITSFKPRYSFVVTWTDAAPYPYSVNHAHESADFQVILATNGSDTHIMFNYDQEYFTWKTESWRHISVGYSGENFKQQELFNSSTFTDVNTGSNVGKNGRWMYTVSTKNDEISKESECKRWLTNSTYTHLIQEAVGTSIPCPCTRSQAVLDQQFVMSSGGVHEFEARFSRNGNKQRCHYDVISGALLQGSPNGGYLDITHTDRSSRQLFDDCCGSLCSEFYSLIKSDNCRRYDPPAWSPAWGDPHFTTFDGASYTFNGLGDYTLVNIQNDSTLEVQIRTEKFSNTTNATVIVGLALQENKGTTIEIYLNRTTNTTEVYINETISTNNALKTDSLELANQTVDSFIITHQVGLALQVNSSNILDITTNLARGVTSVKGLLGNHNQNKRDDFMLKNGTTLPDNSTEESLFDFGSSWMAGNETLFKAKPLNYTADFRPDFISDKNITEYLELNCGTADINKTNDCGDNKACKVDTAATCSQEIGTQSKKTEEIITQKKAESDRFPPNITSDDIVYIGFSINKTVTIEMQATMSANVTVTTNISATDYNLVNSADTAGKWVFNWNTTSVLRDTLTLALEFTATGSNGATSIYRPQLIYCGCENETECNYDDVKTDRGQFRSVFCKCMENSYGEFCNNTVNVCDLDLCYPNVSCNSSNSEPCGHCPEGLVGNGRRCDDNNECYLNTSGCDQICNNNRGSYTCDCMSGYRLSEDSHHCEDKDECEDAKACEDTEYCINTIGSFECKCRPGYASSYGSCVQVTSSFVGVLVFSTTESNVTLLKEGLICLIKVIFKSTDVTYVEVLDIKEYQDGNSRKKRSDNQRKRQADYILHGSGENATSEYIHAFNEYVHNKSLGGIITPEIQGFPSLGLTIDAGKSKVYSDEDAALCKVEDRVNCDLDSTICKVTNGTYTCDCKTGYQPVNFDPSRCQDINECGMTEGNKCRESGGNCSNTVGSYRCHCPNGYILNQNDHQCTDMCLSGPCQNDGVCMPGEDAGVIICKCEDKWTGAYCETENSELSRMKIIAIAVGASAGVICLVLLFVMLGMCRRYKKRRFPYLRTDPLSNLDDFEDFQQSSNLRYHKDTPIDDGGDTYDNDTTFSMPPIPRAKLRESEYNTIEDQSNPDNIDEAAGRIEDESQPLTTNKHQSGDSPELGQNNLSFLHSEDGPQKTSTKRGANAYEYF